MDLRKASCRSDRFDFSASRSRRHPQRKLSGCLIRFLESLGTAEVTQSLYTVDPEPKKLIKISTLRKTHWAENLSEYLQLVPRRQGTEVRFWRKRTRAGWAGPPEAACFAAG